VQLLAQANEITEEAHDSDARLSGIQDALEAGDVDTVTNLVDGLHAADKAEIINQLDEDERETFTHMLSAEQFDHSILPELNPEAAEQVMEILGVDQCAEALSQLETDDVVHLIEDLDEDEREDLLKAVAAPRRTEITESLSYPEDSAGRLMTRKLVSVPDYWTVGNTIDYLRNHENLPENFYVVYVTDPKFHPVGRVLLGRIMQSNRNMAVRELVSSENYSVNTDTDQEDVAHLFTKYALVETGVVNDQGRLVGTITVDDVVHVIHEEEEEDYLRAGGVKSQDMSISVRDTIAQRFPWLFINLLTAVLASVVIGAYSDTIEKLVALAVLMPIVASMGGNAGTQSVTVAVRALATRQLKGGRSMSAIRKELLIGLLNGFMLALIMAAGSYAWYQDASLACVLAAATVITMMIAGFSGAAIPILLNRMGVDPAVSSGVFLTTVTDVIGFLSFLGLAAILLM
jgi:magnesium transporter